MKNTIYSIISAGFLLTSCGQKFKNWQVPKEVINSFEKEFKNKSPNWDKEDSNFEANFKLNDKTMSVLYDAKGNKLETEEDIAVVALPQQVRDYITQHYKNETIKEAAIITRAGGEINYEAEVKGMDILFDKDGHYIKTTKE